MQKMLQQNLYTLVTFLIMFQCGAASDDVAVKKSSNYEGALFDDLFLHGKYDRRVRPVTHPRWTVNVTFVLDLYQIISVDGKSQSITLFCWVYEYWQDYRLQWRAEDYGGLDQLSIDNNLLWIPDTTLINNIQMDRARVEHRGNIVVDLVSSNISQLFFPCTAQYTVGCLFDVTYFPFDVQNCTLTFASWSYDISKIDYILPNSQSTFEAYQESDEWHVLSFNMYKMEIQYECCPRPYAMIFAHLVIRRKPLYYIINLVLPTLIISLISTVGLFASSGSTHGKEDKVNLGITTLLTLSILLLTVSDQIPKGSTSVPLLGWFYLAIMFHLSLETLTAVYMSHPNNEKRVAKLLQYLLLKISGRSRKTPQDSASICNLNNTLLAGDAIRIGAPNRFIKIHEKTVDPVRPANICMIINITITLSIALVTFVGGLIKSGIFYHPTPLK